MRLKFVACAVLSAALALVAAPGIVGSRTPSPVRAIEAAAFQPLQIDASGVTTPVVAADDPALRSANALDDSARFDEPAPPTASRYHLPEPCSGASPCPACTSTIKPPKYVAQGRGQLLQQRHDGDAPAGGHDHPGVRRGGCLERVVNDYGPSASFKPARIIDMYEPDFFKICGCPSWSGLTEVTVSVY